MSRTANKKLAKKDESETESSTEDEVEVIPEKQRVFVYLKLVAVFNVPQEHPTELALEHPNPLTRIDENEKGNKIIDMNRFPAENVTYSLTLHQDDYDDVNTLSNYPVTLTMYENIRTRPVRPPEEDEEEDLEELSDVIVVEPLAQGLMDLLEVASKRRASTEQSIFLYPMGNNQRRISPACKTIWQIYTMMPLLKELSFCNMVFMGFESIYNAPPELMEIYHDLIVEVSFLDRTPNEDGEFPKLTFCTYSLFEKSIIGKQNINQKWETMKSKAKMNLNSLGIYNGSQINFLQLLHNLVRTENVDFRFNEISMEEDEAIVCNSVHRFVLTTETTKILQEAIVFNQQQVVVDLYRKEPPKSEISEGEEEEEEIRTLLMVGVIDPSVIVYPDVNSCRFAVELMPVAGTTYRKPSIGETPKTKRRSRTSGAGIGTGRGSTTTYAQKPKPTFLIISFCVTSPITDPITDLSHFNESAQRRDQLKVCNAQKVTPPAKSTKEICEENYKIFDDMMGALINEIVKRDLISLDDDKNFFCCQMRNMTDKIIELVACDFNIRYKTVNNLEFCNLMTVVYDELVGRVYKILQNCPDRSLIDCLVLDSAPLERLVTFSNLIIFLKEAGKVEMAKFIEQKIHEEFKHCPQLNLYTFMYDVERQAFPEALTYELRPLKEKVIAAQFFAEIMLVYAKYMSELANEETMATAVENKFSGVLLFIGHNPGDIEGWVLLHTLYALHSYRPGMEWARWKYEELYDKPRRPFPYAPKSRWEIYNNHQITFKTQKALNFYHTVTMLLHCGLYRFAEIVFEHIANECNEVDRYFMATSLKILLNDKEGKYPVRTFPLEKLRLTNLPAYSAFQAQINGNLSYFLGDTDTAIKSYERILKTTDLEEFGDHHLALLRYGTALHSQKRYEEAIPAFEKCCSSTANCIIAYYGMGRAYYRLGRLAEAEMAFAVCTNYKMHVPNVWGFLALVNLKLGNNYKALESWKYAKLNPKNEIAHEILDELEKIDHSDISLYVDKI